MDEWISVDDRLPDEALYVLVWKKDSGAGESFYSPDRDFLRRCYGNAYARHRQGKNSGYFRCSHEYGYQVTHWMPRPGAPKE